MRSYFVNQQTNNLQTGRADTGSIGNAARGASALNSPWGQLEHWKLGFLATSGSQANGDLGDTIDGVLVLKQITAASSFDGPALTACTAWTKVIELEKVWYTGTLDLARLELAKLLGTSIRTAKEKLLIQCVADVDGSLDGTTLKLAFNHGDPLADPAVAPNYCYFDFYTAAGVNTTVTGGDVQDRVTITANASGSAVATALAARVNAKTGSIGYTATASGANVTIVKTTVMPVAQSDPLATGFRLALLAIGGTAGSLPDVESVVLNAEFSYTIDGERQICGRFEFTLNNSLYRDGQATLATGLTVVDVLTVALGLTSVTGYTGGTSAKLDGIATAGGAMPTGQVIWFIHATEGIRFFQLTAGTDAEDSPAIIRADDYNASTNARVWQQVG